MTKNFKYLLVNFIFFIAQILVPEMIEAYNSKMGGVDLVDNMVACYRVPYRKKKWWFNIYVWSLNVSAVNAWRLRNRVNMYFFSQKLNKMINNRTFHKNKLDIFFS